MYRIAVKKNASTMEEKDMVLLSKAEYNMAVTSSMKYNRLYVNVSVAGNTKKLLYTNEDIVYFPNGLVFGGTAAPAGLVTRGICGVTTPDAKGACSKDNLYLNYDGNDSYSRPVVLGAGSAGNTIASSNGAKMYSAVRGDQMVAYVKSYLNTSGGVTINNDHSSMKNLDYEHSGHTGFASSAQLDTEIKARKDGDDSLKAKISQEISDYAKIVDETIEYNVKLEADRAKKAESANEARITTLEKETSSLILRNNELSELVGKEMDYQFSEYTTKEATTVIPSTIGERSVVGNDDTRGLVANIGGRTEYSRNLFSGTWTKGTGPTGDVTIAKNGTNSIPVSPNTTYTISLSATNRRTNQIYEYDSSGNYLRCLYDNGTDTFSFTTSEDCHFIRVGQWTSVAEGMTGYPAETMLVKGSTALPYVPYYTGLKSVENPKLKVYGRTDNATPFSLSDVITCIKCMYPVSNISDRAFFVLIDKYGVEKYVVQVFLNDELGTFTKIWNSDYSKLYVNVSSKEAETYFYLDEPCTISTAINRNIDLGALNATTITPLLSDLIKSLSSYERVDIIQKDNGLFKVEKVSHMKRINASDMEFPFITYSSKNHIFFAYLPSDRLEGEGSDAFIDKSSYYHSTEDCSVINDMEYTAHGGGIGVYIWIKDTSVSSVDELNAKLKNTTIMYQTKNELVSTLADDLSLADVSFLQKAGYVITAENDNTTYAVNPSVTLRLVTKGVKA